MSQPPGRPQSGPFIQQCEPGKHAWCRCTHSALYPLCDGSHRGSDIKPIKIILEQPRTIAWCACGRSDNKPYCDGTHGKPAPA